MSNYNLEIGKFGETAATDFYQKQGYRVIERNYYAVGGELDIIAETENMLIFVEVKTRSNEKFGRPIEAVHNRKQLHIQRAAEAYLAENPTEKDIRFDVVEVLVKRMDGFCLVESLHHIPDVIFEVTL